MKRFFVGMMMVLAISLLVACGKNEASGQQEIHSNPPAASQQAPEPTATARPSALKAPDFALQDAEGNTLRLSDLQGKMVILNFWATWCGPCRMEVPSFVRLYEKYHDQGLEIVGISVDQKGWPVVKPFIKDYSINYPIVMANSQVIMAYGGIDAIPTSFIISPDGDVVEKIVGVRPETYFESLIQDLLN